MNYLLLLASVVYPVCITVSAAQSVGSSVTLDYATFNGLTNSSTGIIYFRGMRFADPPTGAQRWRAPVSPPSTNLGIVDATQFGNACLPIDQPTVTAGTSEDCLFGNVYVPIGTGVHDKLPVLVWFHGGGFEFGNTQSAPPELIFNNSSSSPFIFASFEYRVGALGFLGGSDIKADGVLNAGMLDQRAALRWVQRYIHQFGGDSNKVTIWGQSAGAGSTMFHLVANGGNNEGLFRSAIGDSPSLSFTPPYDGTYVQTIYQQFANFSGCSNQGSNTLSCLRSVNSSVIASAGNQLFISRHATLFVFAPIFDGVFLTERPVEAFQSGHFAHVPVLFGSNTNEGIPWASFISDPSANPTLANATETTVYNYLRGQYDTLTRPTFDEGAHLYPLQDYNNSFNLQSQQMYGEARYICTACLITGSASRYNKVFQYHYDNPHLGSAHGAELEAFFNVPTFIAPLATPDADDLVMFQAMREYFMSFVTSGQPVSKNGIAWTPVSASTGSPRMLLHPGNVGMEAVSDALNTRCNFWHGASGEMET